MSVCTLYPQRPTGGIIAHDVDVLSHLAVAVAHTCLQS